MTPWIKRIFNFVATILFLGSFSYLLLPGASFPKQPPDSVQSLEKADTETKWRRAYFTNYTREEVLSHYQKQSEKFSLLGIPLPTYKLNYPPEDAFLLIRDQTRSTFLEEIVQPFRAYLFVNGFKPTYAKDDIWYKGVHYEQKITLRYATSSIFIRVPLVLGALLICFFLLRELGSAGKDLFKNWSGR